MNIPDQLRCHRGNMWPSVIMQQEDISTEQSTAFLCDGWFQKISKEAAVRGTGDWSPWTCSALQVGHSDLRIVSVSLFPQMSAHGIFWVLVSWIGAIFACHLCFSLVVVDPAFIQSLCTSGRRHLVLYC
jgi:hypothetical protein